MSINDLRSLVIPAASEDTLPSRRQEPVVAEGQGYDREKYEGDRALTLLKVTQVQAGRRKNGKPWARLGLEVVEQPAHPKGADASTGWRVNQWLTLTPQAWFYTRPILEALGFTGLPEELESGFPIGELLVDLSARIEHEDVLVGARGIFKSPGRAYTKPNPDDPAGEPITVEGTPNYDTDTLFSYAAYLRARESEIESLNGAEPFEVESDDGWDGLLDGDDDEFEIPF